MRSIQTQKRGQLSVEYLFILGAVLLVALILFTYAQQTVTIYRNDIQDDRARLAVSSAADSARRVYYQGAGARETIWISVPDTADSFRASGVTIEMAVGGEIVHEVLGFNISGNLSSGSGLLEVWVNATEGAVAIGVVS